MFCAQNVTPFWLTPTKYLMGSTKIPHVLCFVALSAPYHVLDRAWRHLGFPILLPCFDIFIQVKVLKLVLT